MYCIHLLKERGVIHHLPVYLDSPMATDATRIYHAHRSEHRLSPEQCEAMCRAATIVNKPRRLARAERSVDRWTSSPASGMATGGRVVHHLKAFAADRRNTILFVSYQRARRHASGAAILQGATSVRIHGEDDADPCRGGGAGLPRPRTQNAGEILQWRRGCDARRRRRPSSPTVNRPRPTRLRARIERELNWPCRVPDSSGNGGTGMSARRGRGLEVTPTVTVPRTRCAPGAPASTPTRSRSSTCGADCARLAAPEWLVTQARVQRHGRLGQHRGHAQRGGFRALGSGMASPACPKRHASLRPQPGEWLTVSHAPGPRVAPAMSAPAVYGHRPRLAGACRAVIGDIAAGRCLDLHRATFITACAGDRLDLDETSPLTRAMIDVGELLDWGRDRVVDKSARRRPARQPHDASLVPIVAARCGLTMPKTSSRAITSPRGHGGTMEVLAPVDLDIAAMRRRGGTHRRLHRLGRSVRLIPADDILIQVERPLDLDSEGQLVASVLSKKAAAGSTHVLIDLPAGPTAKVRSPRLHRRSGAGSSRSAGAIRIDRWPCASPTACSRSGAASARRWRRATCWPCCAERPMRRTI
jgi:hypothetical protein